MSGTYITFVWYRQAMKFETIISPADLHRLISDNAAVVIDCRFSLADTEWGRGAYQQTHLPGARYAHLDDDLSGPVTPGQTGRHPLPDPSAFVKTLQSWGVIEGQQVVVYDQSNGGIAARAWWMFKWMGHKEAALLDGGWQAWNTREYPVTAAVPSFEPSDYSPSPDHSLSVDAARVEEWRQSDEHCVVDARAHTRYLGEVEPIDPVAGHIPGAINHPFLENVLPDGTWLPQSILRDRLQKLGKSVASTAIHCGSGVTACHDILAFQHAGLGMPLLYPGSWSEWITDPARPVATAES